MNLRVDTSSTYSRGYCIEVQEYTHDKWKRDARIQKFQHKGYMQCLFKSRRQAAAYYDFWNPHMRPINEHGTWCSARDIETQCRYIIRKFFRETQTIPPFHYKDKPIYTTSTKRGQIVAITTIYPKYDYLEFKIKKKKAIEPTSNIKLPKLV